MATIVKVHNMDTRYKIKVAVFRHSVNTKEITVNILSIYPIPPKEPISDDIAKVVSSGEEVKFLAEIYPKRK